MKNPSADHRRAFWALFLDSEVKADGQVPGFADWWDKADEWQRYQADCHARACAIKIERDHRDPDECIASGVASLRESFRLYIPPKRHTVSTAEVVELVGTMTRALGWKDSPKPEPSTQRSKPLHAAGRTDVDETSWSHA